MNIWLEYQIDDGLIVNAIVYDGETDYTPPEGLAIVERGDSGAWAGWIYDATSKTFEPPVTDQPAGDSVA
jgi:hypothetical protein